MHVSLRYNLIVYGSYMVIADGPATIWRQNIYNQYDDIGRSVRLRIYLNLGADRHIPSDPAPLNLCTPVFMQCLRNPQIHLCFTIWHTLITDSPLGAVCHYDIHNSHEIGYK